MGKTIALVACVSKKRNLPQPAKDLYCSEWFRTHPKKQGRVVKKGVPRYNLDKSGPEITEVRYETVYHKTEKCEL